MDGLHLCQRQRGQINPLRFGAGHQRSGNMMRLAEGQAKFAHQPVSQIGGGGKARSGGDGQAVAVGGHVPHHAGHRCQRQHQRVCGVEHLFLVFLHVLGIGQRQTLHHREQRHRRPQNAPQLGAQQFGGIGIFLLRHDAAARGPAVGQADKPELRR